MSIESTGKTMTPSPDKRFGQIILLFCGCLGLLLTVGIAVQAYSIVAGLIFTLLFIVLLPAVLFVRFKGIPVVDGLRIKRVDRRVFILSLLAGAGAWSLAIGCYAIMIQLIGPPVSAGMPVPTSLIELMGMLLLMALLPGLCEECLFRGAIQGVLERRGKCFGVIVAALLFGLFHLDPWRILPAAFLGCVFGWLTVRTQSILPAIAAHLANNATAISVGYIFGGSESLPVWLFPSLAVLFVVSTLIIFRLTGSNNRLNEKGPLETVSAGLSKPVAWASGILITLIVVPCFGVIFVVLSMITMVEMHDDGLLPHIKQGDQLVLIKHGSFAYNVKPGDTISFHRGDDVISRVVVRIEEDQTFVLEGEEQIAISPEEIVGELVSIIPSSEE